MISPGREPYLQSQSDGKRCEDRRLSWGMEEQGSELEEGEKENTPLPIWLSIYTYPGLVLI